MDELPDWKKGDVLVCLDKDSKHNEDGYFEEGEKCVFDSHVAVGMFYNTNRHLLDCRKWHSKGETHPIGLKFVEKEIKTKTKTIMTTLTSKMKMLRMGEPNKTLNKAGYMDVDGNWKDEVRELALAQIVEAHMATEGFKADMLALANDELEK